MIGVLFSVIAGALMSLQGVMNTRLSERTGLLESNFLVQGLAFAAALLAMLLFGRGELSAVREAPPWSLLGGLLGFGITLTVVLSIKGLSPTAAISVILVSQLLVAALIDAFGWLGTEKLPFSWHNYAGLALMLGGIVLFKWKKG
jgi:transporter family-2 protein